MFSLHIFVMKTSFLLGENMKKLISVIILICVLCSLVSCSDNRTADELMASFLNSYGASGVVYSPGREEWEYGYINDELFHKIYSPDAKIPSDFAIFLSSHTDSDSECAVFICRDGAERMSVEQMCYERISLLATKNGFVARAGNTVFYSTMSDRARAERIWRDIISR